MTKIHSHILGGAVVLSGIFASELAQAQDAPAAPPPAAPAPPPAAEAPPPPPPPPAAPVALEAPPVPTPAPVPEMPPEVPPPADNPFKVTVGAGFRSALRIQNPGTPKDGTMGQYTKMNDQFIDELNAELRVSGKVTDIIGWTANFTVDGRSRAEHGIGAPIAFQAQALDIIGQLDFMDEFHVWMGRMLTPTDRNNFSGPWFMPGWTYTGVMPTGYFGPRGTEEVGREVGGTIWGDIGKGKFKYYAMIGDLDGNYDPAIFVGNPNGGYASASPLFAGRVQYAAIGSEPGFYGSSTYYGGQDILAIGIAAQYQKDYACVAGTFNCFPGTPGVDSLFGFNADVLFEKKVEGVGTPGIEAAFYHAAGDTRPYNNYFYILPTFTTGEILPYKGKLSALFRFQMGMTGENNGPGPDNTKATHMMLEPSVAYLFKDYFAKIQLSYVYATRNADEPNVETAKNQYLQLGFQIQQ